MMTTGRQVSYLEDFNLAAGRTDMLHVLPVLIGAESVHLDTKRHSLLPTVLPGGELSADAVDLRRHKTTTDGVSVCEQALELNVTGLIRKLKKQLFL